MTSLRKLTANRANARKSAGPRTSAGKRRSSGNSIRHGLSVIAHRKPEFFDQVKLLAMQICGADPNPSLYAQAVLIAESELILRLISIERRAVIEHFRHALAVPSAKRAADIGIARIRFEQTKIAYEEFSQLSAKLVEQGEKPFTVIKPRKCDPGDPPHQFRPPRDLDEYEALQKALPYLERFERYERRAWSRRKKAVRSFSEMKLVGKLRSWDGDLT